MNAENELTGYGQYLKKIRLEKKISIEKLSQITKVSVRMLTLMEAEKDDELPETLIVKGFIRSYARIVGADEAEALHRYQAKSHVLKLPAKRNRPLPMVGLRLWLYFLAVLLVAGAAGFWVITSFPDNGEKYAQPVNTKGNLADTRGMNTQTPIPRNRYSIYGTESAMDKKWRLHARAVEKTWMKVIVDGQIPLEYLLDKDEEIRLEAATGFDLLIGNAHGIRLQLNDSNVHVPGKAGQVASFKIP